MAYAMLTKHSAWYGRSGSDVIGGLIRHGVEIPRSATLEYKSWETLDIENDADGQVSFNLVRFFGATVSEWWEGRLIEVLQYTVSLMIPVHYS